MFTTQKLRKRSASFPVRAHNRGHLAFEPPPKSSFKQISLDKSNLNLMTFAGYGFI